MMNNKPESSTSNQEMDLTDLFSTFNRGFYRLVKHCFKGIDFIFKFWWVILIIIAVGVVLGVLNKPDPSYKSTLILQTNFDSQPYVYNAIKQFNDNLEDENEAFLSNLGVNLETFSIEDVEIEPIINIVDVIEKLRISDRSLGTIFRELNVKPDQGLFSSDMFLQNYKFHKLTVSVDTIKAKKDILALISFINNQPYANELKKEGLKNHEELIAQNEATIKQIDNIVSNYLETLKATNTTSENLTYFNNQANLQLQGIIDKKIGLANDNLILKNYRVGINDLVTVTSSIEISEHESFLDKKFIIYPFTLISIFLSLAFIRYVYLTLKRKIEQV